MPGTDPGPGPATDDPPVFAQKMRGYDCDQVDAHVRRLQGELRRARERIGELERELASSAGTVS